MSSVILSMAARLLVALMLMFSVFLLLRGHNEPGGGFIGGLVAATAFALYAKGMGTAAARAALRVDPKALSLAGLGIAILAGVGGWLGGEPFLTGLWLFLGAGEDGGKGLPLSTVLIFDIGVYLVVIGAVLTFVFSLDNDEEIR